MGKQLKDIFLEYPHVSLASQRENDELLEFYHRTEMTVKDNSIIYKRGNDFFKFLKERTQDFLVFTLRDDDLKLCGIGVASYRPGYIDGHLTIVGYLGDLRVTMNRKLIREWRKFYEALIKHSPELIETGQCKHYQTAIISMNSYSKNNLINSKIPNLIYQELAPYHMLNIIGVWNFLNTSFKNIRWAKNEDQENLIEFFKRDHQQKHFGFDWDNEFGRRLNVWSDFKIENYFLITDPDDKRKILVAGSVWNPIESKQILVPHIPVLYKTIAKLAAFIPGLKLQAIPTPMKPIAILYLNQISFAQELGYKEKVDMMKSIINLIFKEKSRFSFNMLSYCDFKRDNLLASSNFLISQKMLMGLYTVHHKEKSGITRDDLILKQGESSPAFDIALV